MEKEDRTGGEAGDAIGHTAQQNAIQRAMAACGQNDQIAL